jgi:hypothetical protein
LQDSNSLASKIPHLGTSGKTLPDEAAVLSRNAVSGNLGAIHISGARLIPIGQKLDCPPYA